MTVLRHINYANGVFNYREEVEPLGGILTYRRWTGAPEVLAESRPANEVESASYYALEREEAALTKVQAARDAVATLRTWADQARATTVTSSNTTATLQTVVNRLATFFDRFADLVEHQKWTEER